MPTLLEARNEWAEALTAAKNVADNPEAYEKAWDSAEKARKTFENLQKSAEAEKALGLPENQVQEMANDLRNKGDAELIKPVNSDTANLNPSKFVQVGDNIFPVASKDSEGWIKGRAVAAQHPDILKRLGPELRAEKAQQEEAFAYYFRRGLAAMRQNRPDLLKSLQALNALQEDTDSEGGYTVPTDQRFEIIRDPSYRGGRLRARSTVLQTTRDGGTFPTATTVTWAGIAEEASNNDSDPAFGQVPFTIHKSGANNRLSIELLSDSAVNLPALLGQLYAESKGRFEDQQGIEGDGTTEPLGLRSANGAAVSISDITDVWADPPTALEITKAFFEVPEQYRDNASWWMTSGLFAKILTVNSAAAGMHMADLIVNGPTFQIWGKPVFFYDGTGWDDAATIGSGEELGAVGDFSTYYFIDRMGMSVYRDDSVYFATDQVAFKARYRYDSRWTIANAFRILKA
jgi:HK97 family phage major capsid protein